MSKTEPVSSDNREDLLVQFLTEAKLGNAKRTKLGGDASFRRYERITHGDKAYMLMDAPPPAEDVRPFVKIDKHLREYGFSAPQIFAKDVENGFLLLEDLGDSTYTNLLKENADEKQLYTRALDVLLSLKEKPLPSKGVPAYSKELLLREVLLLTDWFYPLAYGKEAPAKLRAEYIALWEPLFEKIAFGDDVLVLRDYHADNLMWLEEKDALAQVGLLDFQDAVSGPATYDLVSLLEDARRDVSLKTVNHCLDYYTRDLNTGEKEMFALSYALMGAQRNCKIVGIFARLCVRDNKPHYLDYLPRVWGHIENDLKHPALSSLKTWIDNTFPPSLRTERP